MEVRIATKEEIAKLNESEILVGEKAGSNEVEAQRRVHCCSCDGVIYNVPNHWDWVKCPYCGTILTILK